MRRLTLLCTAAALGLFMAATTGTAQAAVSADINLHVGDRPAPTVVFEREPDVVLIPNTRVYAVGGLDYDLFRYGRYWYINDDGYWFRAANYRGPFRAVRYEIIPRQIVVVPARYHHNPMHPHGGPPGQMKKQRGYVSDNDDDVVIIRGKDKGKH